MSRNSYLLEEYQGIVSGCDWRRQWQPTPVLLPGKSHGQRSLVGCSPWVAKSQAWLSDFILTFQFHALEKKMAAHSSILAWRIPGTEEPGGLPSMGSHRVGHDWSDSSSSRSGCHNNTDKTFSSYWWILGKSKQETGSSRDIQSEALYLLVLLNCLLFMAGFNIAQNKNTVTTVTAAAKSLQLCPTLCDPRDGSPPGSPVPGILPTVYCLKKGK